jgi:ABC-type sugar transport system ATPase subunit
MAIRTRRLNRLNTRVYTEFIENFKNKKTLLLRNRNIFMERIFNSRLHTHFRKKKRKFVPLQKKIRRTINNYKKAKKAVKTKKVVTIIKATKIKKIKKTAKTIKATKIQATITKIKNRKNRKRLFNKSKHLKNENKLYKKRRKKN